MVTQSVNRAKPGSKTAEAKRRGDQKYRQTHAEQRREWAKKHREKHPDRVRERYKSWAERNPEKRKASQAAFIARKRGNQTTRVTAILFSDALASCIADGSVVLIRRNRRARVSQSVPRAIRVELESYGYTLIEE